MKIDKDLKNKIKYLFDILSKNNIKEVSVEFHGSGDDGNMDVGDILKNSESGVVFADDFNWDEPTIYNEKYSGDNLSLHNLILTISDEILNEKGINWVDGNGNDGAIIYEVNEKNINMSYLVTETAYYDFQVK